MLLTLDLPDQSKRLVVYFIKNLKQYFYINMFMVFRAAYEWINREMKYNEIKWNRWNRKWK